MKYSLFISFLSLATLFVFLHLDGKLAYGGKLINDSKYVIYVAGKKKGPLGFYLGPQQEACLNRDELTEAVVEGSKAPPIKFGELYWAKKLDPSKPEWHMTVDENTKKISISYEKPKK